MIFDPAVCLRHHPPREKRLQRRQALASLAALALAPVAQAQGRIARVGALCYGSPGNLRTRIDAFLASMRLLGYVDGRNVRYDLRYGNGQRDLLPALAQEIVAANPDVILSGSTLATPPLMAATSTIPIVMVTAEEALAATRMPTRPAPNVTGTVNNALEQIPRSLSHLVLALPGTAHVTLLLNPANSAHEVYRATMESAARTARLRFDAIQASTRDELPRAIARAAGTAQALVLMSDATFYDERRGIVEQAMVHHVPVMYPQRGYVEAGGLMSYGQNIEQGFARAADFVDRVLKGAKAADLALERPTKVEFAINRYTATNLGIAISPEALKRADRVVG